MRESSHAARPPHEAEMRSGNRALFRRLPLLFAPAQEPTDVHRFAAYEYLLHAMQSQQIPEGIPSNDQQIRQFPLLHRTEPLGDPQELCVRSGGCPDGLQG